MSNEFEEMDDALSSSFNWYKFPPKTWRNMPIILICVQQPVRINCFGKKIGCTREIFQKVCSNQMNAMANRNELQFEINFYLIRLLTLDTHTS